MSLRCRASMSPSFFYIKKWFGGGKSQIFFIGYQNTGRRDRMARARRRVEKHGDSLTGRLFREP